MDSNAKSQKIEVKNDFEIITHSLFISELANKIRAIRMRPQPPIGKRWKRTPFDELEEEGFFNDPQVVITELFQILNGKSNKSSAKRAFICSLCSEVYLKVAGEFKIVSDYPTIKQ